MSTRPKQEIFLYKGELVSAVQLASGTVTVLAYRSARRLWRAGSCGMLTEQEWNRILAEPGDLVVEKP